MMNAPSAVPLTIAIPTYNRAESLARVLESVAAQAEPQDELIVSDDGSSDRTAEVVRSTPRFRLLRQDMNLGMVENWNACLRAATRNWICLIHDDDAVAPHALSTLRECCTRQAGPALITHRFQGQGDDGALHYRFAAPGRWAVLNCPTIPSGAVVHRSIIEALGFFDPCFKYSADLEYFPRICARYPLVIVENPLVVDYQLHDSNYQFSTWMKPDFVAQIEAIERAIVRHAGLEGEEAERILQERLASTFNYMLDLASKRGDEQLQRYLQKTLPPRRTNAYRISAKRNWRRWIAARLK